MKYEHYQVEDFIKDEFFVSWITESDPTANQFWEKWLKANPEKRVEVERAREFIRSVQYKQSGQLSDPEYSLMFEKLLRSSEMRSDSHRRKRYPKYIYGVAASIILLITAYFHFQLSKKERQHSEVSQLRVATEFGQRKTIQLPDGTIVKLNIGSSIEYPEKFEEDLRKVRLSGEAYFDVAKTKNQPFVIQSSELMTEVLGTSFNVSAYPENDTIAVSVVSGLVKISNEAGDVELLSPSDMGIFNKNSKTINKRIYDPEVLSWYHGILIFKNEPLPKVFEKLERWYGVEFEFEEGISLEGTYSGKYQNKSLELILEGISLTAHIKYSMNQKNVSIYE